MESSLSIGYQDLQTKVGYALGYGRDSTAWTTNDLLDIDDCIESGLRQFYYPPILPGQKAAHEWTFLRPVDSLTIGPTADTVVGVPTFNGTISTVIITGTSFESRMIGDLITFAGSTTSYTIASFVSTSSITVTGDASGELTGDSIAIEQQGDYDLPDYFGGITGTLTFPSELGLGAVTVVSENSIRTSRQAATSDGVPMQASIRPKASDGTDGQRFEIMFYPRPDKSYILEYAFLVLLNKLSASNPYPLGGMQHAETVISACLAIIELRYEDTRGVKWEMFMERLTASIEVDQRSNALDYYGYNGDTSDNSIKNYNIQNQNPITYTQS